ncbi:growth-arrest-specific protein 8 [Thecamonas trahens ATCC 50062]|uniref:Growth-arrest-specific protein 8 n=1 Tax=Thecamonas trahens ATCC 50062 TaxID=461836 RepID=A0A0L0D8U0_THETB|nr:growth-arrest-specific protein 8 [Thecamonas trahens ATCC 50062]KNC47708.1 growth-arrest-specific protein 8 [Thecamonas trahens ATCC 50062]|eukprot:XP_013759190.1 growth-arrest-specific protein 8 [Thecamonas trahens ATCC 50062]
MEGLLKAEREERNYYQLERDKINTFWEVTKKDLDEAKAALRNKDREMEELEENHQVQIKVYKQKVKHLLYEHQNKIAELKRQAESKMTLQHTEAVSKQGELKKTKRELKHKLKEKQSRNELHVRTIQQNHEKEKTKLREDYERQAQEMHANYVQKTRALRREIELRRKTELKELQNRKDLFIQDLMANHEKAFADIKAYYFDITQNNMALIVSLKDHVEELRKQSYADAKRMLSMKADLQRALEPLAEKTARVEELEKELEAFRSTQERLKKTTKMLATTKDELKDLQWEHEVLEQRFAQVEAERDELYDKFVTTIHEVQQKSGFKNLLLEKKMAVLNDELEKKDAQLSEVLAASNIEPGALAAVTKRLEDVLDVKNKTIRALQLEVAKVVKARNDTIRVYEAKLAEYGIPVEDLGFVPADIGSSAPAGLVAS